MYCSFCPPNLGENQILVANDLCFLIQNDDRILVGSVMILPLAHRQTVFDLTEAEWQATFALLKHAKTLIDSKFSPLGYNLGWNCGPVAGQEIFHAHLHVIPRYIDEPFAGKGIRYWLKQETNQRPHGNH